MLPVGRGRRRPDGAGDVGERRALPGARASRRFAAGCCSRPTIAAAARQAESVVSHKFWQGELGGRDAAIGAPLEIGERRFQVVGVTPPTFTGLEVGQTFDVALPICAAALWGNSLDRRDYWWLVGMGRLKAGWTLDQAAQHVRSLSATLFDQLAPTGYQDNTNWKKFRLTAVPGGRGVSQLRAAVFDVIVAAARHYGARAAHRLCKSCEPDACACGGAATRIRGPSGHRCVANPHRHAIAGREPHARGRRRRVRHRARDDRQPRDRCVPDDGRQWPAPRSAARLASRGVHDRYDVSDVSALRAGAGASTCAHRTGRGHQDRRPGPHRST